MKLFQPSAIFIALMLVFATSYLTVSVSFSDEGSSSTQGFEAEYQRALDVHLQGNYTRACGMFQALIKSNPSHRLSDNCQYWIGECYFGLKDYRKAVIEFCKVFTFPRTNKAEDAQLKIGLCYIRLGDKARARRELTRLISHYPGSRYVAVSRRELSKL